MDAVKSMRTPERMTPVTVRHTPTAMRTPPATNGYTWPVPSTMALTPPGLDAEKTPSVRRRVVCTVQAEIAAALQMWALVDRHLKEDAFDELADGDRRVALVMSMDSLVDALTRAHRAAEYMRSETCRMYGISLRARDMLAAIEGLRTVIPPENAHTTIPIPPEIKTPYRGIGLDVRIREQLTRITDGLRDNNGVWAGDWQLASDQDRAALIGELLVRRLTPDANETPRLIGIVAATTRTYGRQVARFASTPLMKGGLAVADVLETGAVLPGGYRPAHVIVGTINYIGHVVAEGRLDAKDVRCVFVDDVGDTTHNVFAAGLRRLCDALPHHTDVVCMTRGRSDAIKQILTGQ